MEITHLQVPSGWHWHYFCFCFLIHDNDYSVKTEHCFGTHYRAHVRCGSVNKIYIRVFIEPLHRKARLKLIKTIYHLQKSLFHFVAPMVCLSHMFVYNAVKSSSFLQTTSFILVTTSYVYTQVTTELNYTLDDLPIHCEHCKSNPNAVD